MDSSGDLPLHDACSRTFASLDVIKFLVERHPASVHVKGRCDRVPFHWAVMEAPVDVSEFLISVAPDEVSAVDSFGKLPIHLAFGRRCRREVVQLLIDRHGGSHSGLDVVDNEGRTVLHIAIRGDCWVSATLQLLLERHPAAAGTADRHGFLPLHLACASPHRRDDLIRYLLESDLLSVLKRTKRGLTPIQMLNTQQSTAMRKFLEQKQDEAVRLIRDALQASGEINGLPDLVISTVCSFVLPRILSPIEKEMIW